MARWIHVVVAAALTALAVGVGAASAGEPGDPSTPVSGDGIVPTLESGNPKCTDLGYEREFKIDISNAPNGAYTNTTSGVQLLGDWSDGLAVTITISNSNGDVFDWTSTVGIDAILVKGGNAGNNFYVYEPPTEDTGDTGLGVPNPDNNSISHVSFCLDNDSGGGGEVTVTKTAVPSWTRGYTWQLEKSVNKDTWKLFKGDTGSSEYTVTATATPTDTVSVSGTITVTNGTDQPVNVTNVSDRFVNPSLNGQFAADCNGDAPGFGQPVTLQPGGVLNCTYLISNPPQNLQPLDGTNTPHVELNNVQTPIPAASVPVDFPDAPTTDSSASADITDNSPAWPGDVTVLATDGPVHTITYRRTFACNGDEGVHTNTAKLTPKVGSEIVKTATVTVKCFELDVRKTAKGTFKREWRWLIEKYASHEQIVLARKKDPNSKKDDLALSRYARSATVDYAVKVYARAIERGFKVEGYIEVKNPVESMRVAHVKAVNDTLLDPNFAADVSNCRILGGDNGGAPPQYGYDIPAGETLRCDYVAMPPAKSGKNQASAMLQNYAYTAVSNDGVHVEKQASGVTPFRTTIEIPWNARAEVDAKARVYDSKMGFLGWASAPGPKRFTYSLHVAPGEHGAPPCGKGTVYNKASVVGNDTERRAEDSVTIPVLVLCLVHAGSDGKKDDGGSDGKNTDPKLEPKDEGVSVNDKGQIDGIKADDNPAPIVCTPSKHYDGKRGAKSDPVWKKIGPKGMKTRFFRAGKRVSYGKVMRGGKSPYRKLARVYVMAKLHALSGVPVDARTSKAMVWSDRYLSKNGPKAKKQRKLMAKHAKVLKRFVKRAKGYRGPSCDAATA